MDLRLPAQTGSGCAKKTPNIEEVSGLDTVSKTLVVILRNRTFTIMH